jgi:DNA-binding NarL/FixJ family response regulator
MKRVLVDDHALFRDGLASLLLAWGHEVNGGPGEEEQAIELVDAGAPNEVLVDVRMPSVGPDAAAGPPAEVAIVVLTVSKEEADLFRAIQAGARGNLPPSLEAPRLRSIIEGVALADPGGAAGDHPRPIAQPGAFGDASGAGLERLTGRELEVLSLVTEGLRNRQIASEMGISENTVKFHLKNIAEKLRASNRAELAARAVRAGLTAGRVPASGRRTGRADQPSGRRFYP